MTPDQFLLAQNKLIDLVQLRLHGLDPWTRGHFAEALVASLLEGATFAEHGAAPCDLNWNGITIAVRATGTRSTDHIDNNEKKLFSGNWKFPAKQAWDSESHDWAVSVPRRCLADVAVLALHDSELITSGWSYFVLSGKEIEEYPSISITPRNLGRAGFTDVLPEQLASEVKKVAGK
jgi:hypothetical protein